MKFFIAILFVITSLNTFSQDYISKKMTCFFGKGQDQLAQDGINFIFSDIKYSTKTLNKRQVEIVTSNFKSLKKDEVLDCELKNNYYTCVGAKVSGDEVIEKIEIDLSTERYRSIPNIFGGGSWVKYQYKATIKRFNRYRSRSDVKCEYKTFSY